jgi:glutamate-1-semialdehyde 2,1-aminomutase
MDLLAPAGSVYQAGTLSGNPVAATAGLTTLQNLTADSYARVDATAQRVLALASDALKAAGVAHSAQQAGNLISIFFTEGPVKSMDDASQQDEEAFARFFNGMLNRGVSLPPSAYEAWFVSTAHDEEAVDVIAKAAQEAAGEVT